MKGQQDFQIFIISRFFVCIIFVVLAECLIWFATDSINQSFDGSVSLAVFVMGIILMIIPIIIASLLFSKALMEEVERMEADQEEFRQQYAKKRNLMLSDIAHDLRTPITTIAGYSKALNDGLVVTEEKRKEYLQAIEDKSERVSDLISLLFDYLRLDSENYGLKMAECDVAELLREVAASLYSDMEEKGMEFVILVQEEPCMVMLDRVQFSRVIVNLINNAIKHNAYGTEITLELRQQKNRIKIFVSDNGDRISPFLAEHIFEPFAMGNTSRDSQSGSGLGLSIAKKIIEMHGWTLILEQNYEEQQKSFIIEIKI